MTQPAPDHSRSKRIDNESADRTGTRLLGGIGFGLAAVVVAGLIVTPFLKIGFQFVAIAPLFVLFAPYVLVGVLVLFVAFAIGGACLGAACSPDLVDATKRSIERRRDGEAAPGLVVNGQEVPWKYVGVAFKGQHIAIAGVNPWGRPWRPVDSEPLAVLPNPKANHQLEEFRVYRLGVKDREIVFAAAEISPSEYAFYLRTQPV